MTDCLVRLWLQIFIQYSTLDRFHLCLADICGIVSHTLKISERASVPFILSRFIVEYCVRPGDQSRVFFVHGSSFKVEYCKGF